MTGDWIDHQGGSVRADCGVDGMTWKIVVEMPTPSPNELNRMHWAERRRLKETFGWLLASALNKLPKIPKATGPRRLVIERHGRKALDQDNLAGGAKGLIDCIREQRLILDDNPNVCQMEFRQVVERRGGPHTVIFLEDVA